MPKTETKPEIVETTALELVNPGALISQAIAANVGIDTLERLFALREKLRAEAAERAFNEAMSAFQGECPVIHKGKPVYNKDGRTIRYYYAPMELIVPQAQQYLAKNGLSYSFDCIDHERSIEVVLTVLHVLGHSKSFRQVVPVDPDAYMNETQKRGSARTYGQRYVFCGALGIVVSGEDDDGSIATEAKKANAAPPRASSPASRTTTPTEAKPPTEAPSDFPAPRGFTSKQHGPCVEAVGMVEAYSKEGKLVKGAMQWGVKIAGQWHNTTDGDLFQQVLVKAKLNKIPVQYLCYDSQPPDLIKARLWQGAADDGPDNPANYASAEELSGMPADDQIPY